MGTTTKIVAETADGLYDVIHVSMSGYPAAVGRRLLDHHATPDDVTRMYALADERDSRYIYSFPRAPLEATDFVRGERDISISAFPVEELGQRLSGWTFFLHDGGRWYWVGVDAARRMKDAIDAEGPLSRTEILEIATPLLEAVEEDERPARENAARHASMIEDAQAQTPLPDTTFALEERDGAWRIVMRRDGREDPIDPQAAMTAAQNLAALAQEAARRSGISALDLMRHSTEAHGHG